MVHSLVPTRDLWKCHFGGHKKTLSCVLITITGSDLFPFKPANNEDLLGDYCTIRATWAVTSQLHQSILALPIENT